MRGEPHLVGRYEIRERLGTGGFASVYRAYDPLLDIERAIKVLHRHLADDPTIRDRFIREGRALARIRHPNLVQVFDAGEAEGRVYLTMELVRGTSLEHILQERGRLPLPELVPIVDEVADALAAVHAAQLVHRDIKPDNILLEQGTNRAVLLDLGKGDDTSPGRTS